MSPPKVDILHCNLCMPYGWPAVPAVLSDPIWRSLWCHCTHGPWCICSSITWMSWTECWWRHRDWQTRFRCDYLYGISLECIWNCASTEYKYLIFTLFFGLILIEFPESRSYMSNVQSFYSIIGFVDCNTNGLTMAFCAFVILVVSWICIFETYMNIQISHNYILQLNWLPLYAIFLLFLVKLFAICVLGTLIEMAVRSTQHS